MIAGMTFLNAFALAFGFDASDSVKSKDPIRSTVERDCENNEHTESCYNPCSK
jgi:hypothetical protein